MTSSPYQHQDPRQIALQRQIEQERQDGDLQRLQRLELLWVHRYGVKTLPVADRSMDQPGDPWDASEPSPVEVSQAEVDRFLGQASLDQSDPDQPTKSQQDQPDQPDQPTLDDQEPAAPEAVGPVPVASPQRLRRWLKPLNRSESSKAS